MAASDFDLPPPALWPAWHRCAEVVVSFHQTGGDLVVFHPAGENDMLPSHEEVLLLFRSFEQSSRRRRGEGGTIASWVAGDDDYVPSPLALWAGGGGGGGALVVAKASAPPPPSSCRVWHCSQAEDAVRYARTVEGGAVVVRCLPFLNLCALHHLPVAVPSLRVEDGGNDLTVPGAPTPGAWLRGAVEAAFRRRQAAAGGGGRSVEAQKVWNENLRPGDPPALACIQDHYLALPGCSPALVAAVAQHLEKHLALEEHGTSLRIRDQNMSPHTLPTRTPHWVVLRQRMESYKRYLPPAPALPAPRPLAQHPCEPLQTTLCIHDRVHRRWHHLPLRPPEALGLAEGELPRWLQQPLGERWAEARPLALQLRRQLERFADLLPLAQQLALHNVWSRAPELLLHQWSVLRMLAELPAAVKVFMDSICVRCSRSVDAEGGDCTRVSDTVLDLHKGKCKRPGWRPGVANLWWLCTQCHGDKTITRNTCITYFQCNHVGCRCAEHIRAQGARTSRHQEGETVPAEAKGVGMGLAEEGLSLDPESGEIRCVLRTHGGGLEVRLDPPVAGVALRLQPGTLGCWEMACLAPLAGPAEMYEFSGLQAGRQMQARLCCLTESRLRYRIGELQRRLHFHSQLRSVWGRRHAADQWLAQLGEPGRPPIPDTLQRLQQALRQAPAERRGELLELYRCYSVYDPSLFSPERGTLDYYGQMLRPRKGPAEWDAMVPESRRTWAEERRQVPNPYSSFVRARTTAGRWCYFPAGCAPHLCEAGHVIEEPVVPGGLAELQDASFPLDRSLVPLYRTHCQWVTSLPPVDADGHLVGPGRTRWAPPPVSAELQRLLQRLQVSDVKLQVGVDGQSDHRHAVQELQNVLQKVPASLVGLQRLCRVIDKCLDDHLMPNAEQLRQCLKDHLTDVYKSCQRTLLPHLPGSSVRWQDLYTLTQPLERQLQEAGSQVQGLASLASLLAGEAGTLLRLEGDKKLQFAHDHVQLTLHGGPSVLGAPLVALLQHNLRQLAPCQPSTQWWRELLYCVHIMRSFCQLPAEALAPLQRHLRQYLKSRQSPLAPLARSSADGAADGRSEGGAGGAGGAAEAGAAAGAAAGGAAAVVNADWDPVAEMMDASYLRQQAGFLLQLPLPAAGAAPLSLRPLQEHLERWSGEHLYLWVSPPVSAEWSTLQETEQHRIILHPVVPNMALATQPASADPEPSLAPLLGQIEYGPSDLLQLSADQYGSFPRYAGRSGAMLMEMVRIVRKEFRPDEPTPPLGDLSAAQRQLAAQSRHHLDNIASSFLDACKEVDKHTKALDDLCAAHRRSAADDGAKLLSTPLRQRLRELQWGAPKALPPSSVTVEMREEELLVEEEEEEDFDPESGGLRHRKRRRRTTGKSRGLRMTEIGLSCQHQRTQQCCRQRKIELLQFLEPMLRRLAAAQQRYLRSA
jgi:hypothetical protein